MNDALLAEKRNQKDVLSLVLMWIFRKRAFSVSRAFGLLLVEEKDDHPYGQVDLEGESIYEWTLVGFMVNDGRFKEWSVDLSYNEFWAIRSNQYFTYNKVLFSD